MALDSPQPADPHRVYRDQVCLACGCLCDDIELRVDSNQRVTSKHACQRGAAWFAQQNPFEWMFNPVRAAQYASLDEASAFVADDDMVMVVSLNGETAAYPVRQMAYHHIAQDVVGGVPIVVTY